LPLLHVKIVFKTHTGVATDQEGLGADGGPLEQTGGLLSLETELSNIGRRFQGVMT
jgi:hypothetical protein